MTFKKFILIPALLLIVVLPSLAQKKGYKELQIGKSIRNPEFDVYKILIDNKEKNHFQIQECKVLKICDLQIDLIDIYTDSGGVINEVYVFTKKKDFKDSFELLDDVKSTFLCLKNAIKSPDKYNYKNELYEAVWIFEDENFGLEVTTKQHSIGDRDFKEYWVFRWSKID